MNENWSNFLSKLSGRLNKMLDYVEKNNSTLYETDIDKDELWEAYLSSFPEGTNKMYRKRREYDCGHCRNFIKTIGGAVAIVDGKIHTIWEIDTDDVVFQPVVDALRTYVESKPIKDIWRHFTNTVGVKSTNEYTEDKQIIKWTHMYTPIPERLLERKSDIPTAKAKVRDRKNVFKRSLDEITEEAVDTVLELIASNTLYRGQEWERVLKDFRKYQREYNGLSDEEKDTYTWTKAMTIGDVIGRIRNHSIGTLLVNISEGMDLDNAVKAYENVVAPANYKRPKAIFTKKMLEDAKKTVTDLGYMDSLQRRFARLDDITVNNILFCNRDAAPRIQGGLDIFDEMSKEVAVNPKKFSKVEEISVEKFVSDVLPTAKELEVLFENRHKKNMVSLIAPVNKNAKNMMKWNNPFSWAYSGNMTDSEMKERVKNAGGAVDGILRFSIQWNAGKDWNRDDFDAHCKTPCQHIFFSHMVDSKTQGRLDVDVINPVKGKPAVENITWADKSKMVDGDYEFFVHNYCHSNGTSGFTAEIEFDGQIYEFEYDQPLRQGQNVPVATVTLKDGVFTIKEKLPSTTSSREIWGINTNQFVPVTVMCYSPNYWDEQTGIGHKHYLFMLNGCVNEDTPNGFFNEFLKQELVQHKRVFEALGNKMHVADDPNQLSGIGFSSTKRDDVIVKVKGATERVLKIKF
jgi:hypothetical protein